MILQALVPSHWQLHAGICRCCSHTGGICQTQSAQHLAAFSHPRPHRLAEQLASRHSCCLLGNSNMSEEPANKGPINPILHKLAEAARIIQDGSRDVEYALADDSIRLQGVDGSFAHLDYDPATAGIIVNFHYPEDSWVRFTKALYSGRCATSTPSAHLHAGNALAYTPANNTPATCVSCHGHTCRLQCKMIVTQLYAVRL